MSRISFAWLLTIWATVACQDGLPTINVDTDLDAGSDAGADSGEGDDWAPWPPEPGPAGLLLLWKIEGQPPTAASCEQVDLGRVELTLRHPVVDFEIWSPAELKRECIEGSVELSVAHGLAPGRYRFKVTMFHQDDTTFTHTPTGEVVLVENQVTTVAGITITEADQ